MQEIEFTKEDEYCIRNFGYNEVKDYEDLKQLDSTLIFTYIQKLEQQLQQKENIIKEVRERLEYLLNNDTIEINGRTYIKQEADNIITNYIKEILDKGK